MARDPNVQCKACPWRTSTRPEVDIPGGYSEAKHRALASTVATPGQLSSPGGALRLMACHESPVGAESACVGWLANQLGPGNNIPLRLSARDGRYDHLRVVGEQHARLEDTFPKWGGRGPQERPVKKHTPKPPPGLRSLSVFDPTVVLEFEPVRTTLHRGSSHCRALLDHGPAPTTRRFRDGDAVKVGITADSLRAWLCVLLRNDRLPPTLAARCREMLEGLAQRPVVDFQPSVSGVAKGSVRHG